LTEFNTTIIKNAKRKPRDSYFKKSVAALLDIAYSSFTAGFSWFIAKWKCNCK
jgi:hypothetical protein